MYLELDHWDSYGLYGMMMKCLWTSLWWFWFCCLLCILNWNLLFCHAFWICYLPCILNLLFCHAFWICYFAMYFEFAILPCILNLLFCHVFWICYFAMYCIMSLLFAIYLDFSTLSYIFKLQFCNVLFIHVSFAFLLASCSFPLADWWYDEDVHPWKGGSETDQLEVYFLFPTFASLYGFITPYRPSLKSSIFSNLNLSLPLQLLTHVVILVSSFYHAFLFIIAMYYLITLFASFKVNMASIHLFQIFNCHFITCLCKNIACVIKDAPFSPVSLCSICIT